MSDNTLKNQKNPFTATELLEFANLQIAAEVLYGKLTAPAGNPTDLTANENAVLSEEYLVNEGNKHSKSFYFYTSH